MVGLLASLLVAAGRRRRPLVVLVVAGIGVFAATACVSSARYTSGQRPNVTRGGRFPASPQPSGADVAGSEAADAAARATAPRPRSAATVGPLFGRSMRGTHGCTAAVVASASRDVIVTAAHCVSGTGAGLLFVPGYYKGQAPYGSWIVRGAYVPAGWLSGQDPGDDVAFLTVRPSPQNAAAAAAVQDVVGADRIGPVTPDLPVTVAGYAAGRDDAPLVCAATVYMTSGSPSFDCGGFADGTSGSPWLAEFDVNSGSGVLTAIIGGLHEGGCTADTSYGVALTRRPIQAALARAVAADPPDSVPSGSSNC